MAAYRRVYDSRHLQADSKEPGSAPEPHARQSSIGYLYLYPFYSDSRMHPGSAGSWVHPLDQAIIGQTCDKLRN